MGDPSAEAALVGSLFAQTTELGRPQGPSLRTAQVAIPLPIPNLFSYTLPPDLASKAQPGVRVRIPFKNREMVGYLVGFGKTPSHIRIKPIAGILDGEPVISERMLQLTKKISEYYGASWGEAIENALPRWVKYGKKATRAMASISDNRRGAPCGRPIDIESRSRAAARAAPTYNFELTPDQHKAFGAIREAFRQRLPKPILLYGVTGCGKSEIYIRAIQETLKRDQSAICLVPEIALTEQIRHFFKNHFGGQLEILHSKLAESERFLAWKRIEKGERRVVLGPRSAVFAPVPRLGLIIMDEEHEGSYKQETTPRYHAREVARWRAEQEGALFVMGSATPSLEIMNLAAKHDVTRLDLLTRIDERKLPHVTLIDLKNYIYGTQRKLTILTPPLSQAIEQNLKKKEGTLLLLNRRGYSTLIQCPRCSQSESCVSCQVNLTYHQEDEFLLCHYCNYQKKVPDQCSHCQSPLLRFRGFGTEKVENEVARAFPTARIARMDTDSMRKRGSHETLLRDFRARKIDILIGTQMIAKGFDFPHVTLVGVVLADVGLMLPDFRSAERTFQLLTQVAGRAGRGKLPGRVLIQTFSPDHPSIRFAKDHDYLRFQKHESAQRLEFDYPPYAQLINLIVRSRDEKKSYLFVRALRDELKKHLSEAVSVIGPAPLPFYKLRGHFRWHLMLKSKDGGFDNAKILQALRTIKKPSGIAYALDVDPMTIL